MMQKQKRSVMIKQKLDVDGLFVIRSNMKLFMNFLRTS